MWVWIWDKNLKHWPNHRFCHTLGIKPNLAESRAKKLNPSFHRFIFSFRAESLPQLSQVCLSVRKRDSFGHIASHLTEWLKESLLIVRRRHIEAIGWTMTDFKGLSLSIVQYRIHLTEEATPKWDSQCILNPIMQEAVRVEILKLLDNGIIYLISDS